MYKYSVTGAALAPESEILAYTGEPVQQAAVIRIPGFFDISVFVWRFHEMKKSIEELLQSPYWVIDILPLQVPKDSPEQYFTIEKYFLQDKQFAEVKQKHIN